jgi:hypothetical protein
MVNQPTNELKSISNVVVNTADLLFRHDRPQIQVNEPGMWQSAVPIS